MNALALQTPTAKPPWTQRKGRPPGRKPPYTQAVEVQDRLMADIRDPKTKPSVRAALARAWDVLEERKRILRGRPLPGQYRPDLHPDQLLKALKRAKIQRHGLLDLGSSMSEPREAESEPPPQPGPVLETPTADDERPPETKVGG